MKRQFLILTLHLIMVMIASGCSSTQQEVPVPIPSSTKTESPEPTTSPIPSKTIKTPTPEYLPGISYFNFEFEGVKRFYMVYVPEGFSQAETYPLLIYLHSYGGPPLEGIDYAGFDVLADQFEFLLALPSGKPDWNSGISDNPDWAPPDLNDIAFLDLMIDQISHNFNLHQDRIYATGFSNGGFMSYKLACQLSSRIAAVASVGGVISESTLAECQPDHPMPVMQIHGTVDSVVKIDGAEGWHTVKDTLDFWVGKNQCLGQDIRELEDINPNDNSTVEIISNTDCKDNSLVVYYNVLGGGHKWPGADTLDSFTNQDFNASLTIWEFFNGYQLLP